MPGGRVGIRRGRTLRPVPQGTPASGGDGCRRIAPLLRQALPSGSATKRVPSRDFTRNNKACLPVLAGVRKLLADVRRVRDRLAANIEDDVADLEAVIGGNAVRIDRGNDYAVTFRTRTLGCSAPASGRASACRCRNLDDRCPGSQPGARLAACRALAFTRLLLTLTDQIELDRGAWRHRADPASEFARVGDRTCHQLR